MNMVYLLLFGLLFNVAYADNLSNSLQLGQETLANGYYREAEQHFAVAELTAKQQNDVYNIALVQALQGYMALQRQQYDKAEQLLTMALTQAKQHGWLDLAVRTDLYLAQFYQHKQNNKQATAYLQHAIAQSDKLTDKALLVSAFYQLAQHAIKNHDTPQATHYLKQASQLMQSLPSNATTSQLWLNIGYQQLQLYLSLPQPESLAAAFESLNTALNLAKQLQQPRIQASALKHLASLYKQQEHANEAIDLLLSAIASAQQQDASDLLVELESQLGQIYQQQHNNKLAIAAYRRAVQHIERIRIDIPVSYQQGRSSFRDTFAPIYLALADLLLQESDKVKHTPQQALLKEAQDYIERMKKSELEDYFQSRCDISATPLNLQKTDAHAAAIYPILLPDRLEIIVYTANGLYRFTSPVTAEEVEKQTRLFANHLRHYDSFSNTQASALLLYHWLIAPAETLLKQQQITTLIYIPDGALRLIPLAALYDGHKFVIENYAVVTSVGMTFFNNQTMRQQNRMLLAGVSVPGEVVHHLPDSVLENLVSKVSKDYRAYVAGRDLSATATEKRTRALREILKNTSIVEKLHQLLSLPGVDTEIKHLAEQNQVDYLLNESFSLENFKQVLTEQPHDILHIASHGFFGSTAEESFIMSHDQLLDLNQLQNILSSDYFKQFPIDLLTLSACQTAEGDDKSPLGIGGVAIKTKVHSALGSLWSVSDKATTQLMTTFYQSLNEPNQTKAKALQEAMLSLLKQKEFANPSFWSPFILIGNWQ